MNDSDVEIITVHETELTAALERIKAGCGGDEDFTLLGKIARAYLTLQRLLEKKSTTLGRLRRIIFGAKTEKTSSVLKEPAKSSADITKTEKSEPKKGHGRNGVTQYRNANHIQIDHESLHPGNQCPCCERGKVYKLTKREQLVRVLGQSPLQATVIELEQLRCSSCGKVFKAKPPEGTGTAKYDETAASMIGLLKYGSGLPFHRQQKLNKQLGLPLPATTQWEIVEGAAQKAEPAYEELVRQAAQGKVLHNDDTGMTILELTGKKEPPAPNSERSERTGTFTSGIVSVQDNHQIGLFFTGNKHAGENLEQVLQKRAAELSPPIQMCDALSRNEPSELETIVANCLGHCRRKFVDVTDKFPDECRYLLEALKLVYKNDADAKKQRLSDDQRLAFHQEHSQKAMDDLKTWAVDLIENRKIEPNSGLGDAITYMLNHWDKLTLFLRVAGAPLDNNICERALKKAILHRKNALFYKTLHGAHVGDIFMSLIYTAELCDANPFDYLTELQRHAKEVAKTPAQWMPWNYRTAIVRLSSPRAEPTSHMPANAA